MNLSYVSSLCRIIVRCVKYQLDWAYICCACIVMPLLVHLVAAHFKLWLCVWRAMQSVCANRAWTVYARCDCAQHCVSDLHTIRLCLHILWTLLLETCSLTYAKCSIWFCFVHTHHSNCAYVLSMCIIVLCHDWLGRTCAQVCCVPFSDIRVSVLSMAKGAAGDKHKGDLRAICARCNCTTGNAEIVSIATSELWLRQ